jgi:hypothetical protein
VPNGNGIKYYSNSGDIYDGDWLMGKRNGKGVCYFSNGQKFEGEFKNGKRHGNGIEYDSEGNILFDGEWIDNEPNESDNKNEIVSKIST